MQEQSNVINIVSEISVTFTPSLPPSQCPKISSPKEAHDLFRSNWNMDTFYLQEELKVMFLDHSLHVMGIMTICTGSKTTCNCDLPKLFGAALKASCTKFILAHNHPSGCMKASTADINLTKKVTEGCRLLDLQLLDHQILGDDGYLSMADEGLLL
ncbi:JAB domain-containing protein [Chitinophaga pollutisoli]|uniref:JAB domain-containing protein n=1 Tax=Chitinophaga pollutisoli TaxID=3133966 RepID=A0ABZ2YQA1_9BACT